MNIETLTKSQIVLLTLLVSFVTSIATGIVTVALMDQAPPAITQTINRVVEHTVERIVPAQTQTAAAASPKIVNTTTEKTVIVKESEAIAQAVAIASPSVVRIVPIMNERPAPIVLGVMVSSKGVVTDGALLRSGVSYAAILPDGSDIQLKSLAESSDGLVLLSVSEVSTTTPAFKPIAIGRSEQVQLGQTVVALTGLRTSIIASGIVTSLGGSSSSTTPVRMDTSIEGSTLAPGTLLIDTDGALIGMFLSKEGRIAPSSNVAELLAPTAE